MAVQSTDVHISSPQRVAMDRVLTRVGEEILQLATVMDQFQSLISPLVVAAGSKDRGFLREVQNFDHITQKLTCLAEYLLVIADHTPQAWAIDPNVACEVVTLAELSNRLGGAKCDPLDENPSEGGECELF